ncbi:E3 ubiquitin-protein ligase TRIM21-like [Palaemon carinicauda]|uniref:E3 ubiquitin-protein ligase TRIM21-like n=1 Tax=Palaemon carinicauda TaxID=392227 RepID=UPI0035B5F7D6
MASSTSKECGICNNDFNDEDRCPRILSCFHCLCSECINQLIKSGGVTCPFCRCRTEGTSVQNFAINTCLLDLLKYVAERETPNQTPPRETSFGSCLRNFREGVSQANLVRCQTTKSQLQNSIQGNSDLRKGILEAKKKIKDDMLIKMKQQEKSYELQLVHLEEQNEILRRQLNMISEKERLLRYTDEKLQEANDFTIAGPIMDQTEEITQEIMTIVNDLKDVLSVDEKSRLCIRKVLEKTNQKISLIEEILISDDDEDVTGLVARIDAPEVEEVEEDAPQTINAHGLLVTGSPERHLAREGKLCAVQEREGRTSYGKITLTDDGKVCLHRLRQDLGPPANALTISYDDVASLTDMSVNVAFLELAAEERTIKRLYIRLSPFTKFGQHFVALCTGEMGPSYANTIVLDVMRKDSPTGERVLFGDYENNDGSGGKALMPGLNWSEWVKGTYISPAVAGAVGSVLGTEENAAQFVILTKSCSGQNLGGCFGVVEEGLDHLNETVSLYSNIRDVYIKDCGVVVNL